MLEGSRNPPNVSGKTGVAGRMPTASRAWSLVVAQVGRLRTRSPVLDLVTLRTRPSPGSRAMVWVIFDGAGFEVDLVPEDGEGFADPDAGSEHEGDEVGEIR